MAPSRPGTPGLRPGPSRPIPRPTLPGGGGGGGGHDEDDDRLILWAHGLSGNQSAWGPVAADVTERYHASQKLIDYTELQVFDALRSVSVAVESLLPARGVQTTEDPTRNPDETMYIGHSLGGLVGRDMLRFYHGEGKARDELKFGRFVSVASPHAGSRLGSLEAAAEIQDIINEGCIAFTEGPALDVVSKLPNIPNLSWLNFRLGPLILLEGPDAVNATEAVQGFIGGGCTSTLFELLTSSLFSSTFLPEVASELDPRSDALRALNGAPDPYGLPKANIVTWEEDPVVWRLLSSVVRNAQSAPVYGADDDTQFIGVIGGLLAERKLAAFALRNEADYLRGWFRQDYELNPDGTIDYDSGSLPLRVPKPGRARNRERAAAAYERGIAWFENFEGQWLVLGGARTFEVGDKRPYRCDCVTYEYGDVVHASTHYE